MAEIDGLRAWAAGFFDGDGCVTITKTRPTGRRKNPCYALQVSVANRDLRPLQTLKENWGGTIITRAAPRNFYEWNPRTQQAVLFLRDILPYLRTYKNLQAKFGIQFQEHKTRGKRRFYCLTSREIEWREMHRELIRLARRKV